MGSTGAGKRRPAWPFAALGLFLLFLVIGLLVISLRDLPAPTDREIVEKPFAEHIAFLKELAFACPDPIGSSLLGSPENRNEEALRKYNEIWKKWSEKAESRPDLMSNPAILGAAVYVMNSSGGNRAVINLVGNDDLEPSWRESAWSLFTREPNKPDVNHPLVREWHEGGKHLVRYEARFPGPEGMKMGLRLLVDLNRVERTDSAH